MIRFFFLFLITSYAMATDLPLLRVSVDRTEYDFKERAILSAEINVSPANAEYEFILETALNEGVAQVTHMTSSVTAIRSNPLTKPGTNRWSVSLFFIKKTLSAPMRKAIAFKKTALSSETEPARRAELEYQISSLEQKLQELRRLVKVYTADFIVRNALPTALFTSQDIVSEGGLLKANASNSFDPDGQIVRYDWTISDGTEVPDGGPTISHTFDRMGTFSVSLQITDNSGAVATYSKEVTVVDYQCDVKNYGSLNCSGTFVASNPEDLAKYYSDFGRESTDSYKNLHIAYSTDPRSSIEFHTPCKLSFAQGIQVKGQNICVSPMGGFKGNVPLNLEATRRMVISGNQAELIFPSNSHLKMERFYINNYGNVKFSQGTQVYGFELTVISHGTLTVESGVRMEATGSLSLDGISGCDISPDAELIYTNGGGGCL